MVNNKKKSADRVSCAHSGTSYSVENMYLNLAKARALQILEIFIISRQRIQLINYRQIK